MVPPDLHTRPRTDGSPADPPPTFSGASVVQLVTGRPGRPDAAVVELHPATVALTASAVVASEGGISWSWPYRDLAEVHHAPDGDWSLLVVPGVPDHGVAVASGDVEAFRRELAHRCPPTPPPVVPPPSEPPRHHVPPVPVPAPTPAASPPPAPPVTVDPPEPGRPHHVPPPAPTARVAPGPAGPGSDTRVIPTVVAGAPPAGGPALAGLEARDVSAWFGPHQVLERVSLDMPAGEVTALIGPSGCGKSTFLRILNRMHELVPTATLAGEVRLDGQDVYEPGRKLTDARRQIGMVFQKPNPFPAMSVYDNVVASLKLTGTKASSEAKDDLVETCLSKAGLWTEVRDRLRQPGGGLSGGQQQRLCIARALAIRPRVLLMDEPCSALDPTSTRRIEQTITELADEVTIVIVTHNMQQAARVSNRCAFFLAEQGTPGVIVEHGPTEAMFEAPQDPRTSDYVNGRFG